MLLRVSDLIGSHWAGTAQQTDQVNKGSRRTWTAAILRLLEQIGVPPRLVRSVL